MLPKIIAMLGLDELLKTWGKKAVVGALGWIVSTILALINSHWHLGLPTEVVIGPGVGASVYTAAQAHVDAKTLGATSSVVKNEAVPPADDTMPNSDQSMP